MATEIAISAEVHVQELAQEIAFLRNRNLLLAQALHELRRQNASDRRTVEEIQSAPAEPQSSADTTQSPKEGEI